MILVPIDKKRGPEFLELINKNRGHLRQWVGWLDDIQTLSDIEKYIDTTLRDQSVRKLARFWICEKNKIVGIVHLTDIDWHTHKAMIGYWISEEYQGNGHATSAVREAINFAFNDWKLSRIEILCALENVKSQAIPERLGFKREGIIKKNEWLYDHYVDHQVFSLTKEVWSR